MMLVLIPDTSVTLVRYDSFENRGPRLSRVSSQRIVVFFRLPCAKERGLESCPVLVASWYELMLWHVAFDAITH